LPTSAASTFSTAPFASQAPSAPAESVSAAASPALLELQRREVIRHFVVDKEWIDKAPKERRNDPEYHRRLLSAFNDNAFKGNEQTKKALRHLLTLGLAAVPAREPQSFPSSDVIPSLASTLPSTPPLPVHQPLASYIARFLNCLLSPNEKDHPEHQFAFKASLDVTLGLSEIVRSRLFFLCLAQEFQVNIFLFSSKCKTRLFETEGAQHSIGFFHSVDNFLYANEYLVLTTSRNPPKVMMAVDPQSSPSSNTYAVAQLRTGPRSRPTSRTSDVTITQFEEALRKAFDDRIGHSIKEKIKTETKKSSYGKMTEVEQDTAMSSHYTDLMDDLSTRTQLPRGAMGTFDSHLKGGHNIKSSADIAKTHAVLVKNQKEATDRRLEIWKDVVKKNIEEETWGAIRKKVEEAQKPPQDPDDDGDENGSGDEVHDKKNLRTCTVSLNQILRPDLEANGRKVFVEAVTKAQGSITDHISDLSILVLKTTLQVAAGKAYGDAVSSELQLQTLLPDGFIIRDQTVKTSISVAPIPDGLPNILEDALKGKIDGSTKSDLAFFFSQDHIQFLNSAFLGERGPSGADAKINHELWIQCAEALGDPEEQRKQNKQRREDDQRDIDGYSHTINEAVREFTTAVKNLWNGSIYSKMLEFLLRILLRLHLAPRREERNRANKLAKALEKNAKDVVRRAENSDSEDLAMDDIVENLGMD
ncbi:hypothetical protein BGZ51_000224, partial [Haplosporangium sp. Z 767]